jgi:hypothetical protein
VELGGGDGTFLLALGRRVADAIGAADVTLVDQQLLVTPATRQALDALSWHVQVVQADVFEWLDRRSEQKENDADITMANLFLHHFDDGRLKMLLRHTAAWTRLFVACEPRRSRTALAAAALTRLIGGNDVTVHDAVISVRAGFRGRELSALWPSVDAWQLNEYQGGPFTHTFVANRLMANQLNVPTEQ